jgi:hypothetical protein
MALMIVKVELHCMIYNSSSRSLLLLAAVQTAAVVTAAAVAAAVAAAKTLSWYVNSSNHTVRLALLNMWFDKDQITALLSHTSHC